jgi:hypothetical protein
MRMARASPKKCRVCRLPTSEAELVEGGILIGWSARSISARFSSITRRDVQRHMSCIAIRGKEQHCG